MITQISNILRAATREDGEPVRVLTAPTHESLETNLSKTDAIFYAMRGWNFKDWNKRFRPLPKNYILLDKEKAEHQLPIDVTFDLVIAQHKFGQYQVLSQFAQQLGLPLISIEHTDVMPWWSEAQIQQLKQMRGDINIFITEYSRSRWGWSEDEAIVIHHGIDTDEFCPDENVPRKKHSLTVVNDFINRGNILGFDIWQRVTSGLGTRVLGDTPGLSQAAESVSHLVHEYREASCFVNTSIYSPIPTVVLEAMACACPPVSLNNCMLPEIIKHGENGFITNDEKEMREYVRLLINNEALSRKMGQKARETILERFPLQRFVDRWNEVFRSALEIR